MILTVLQSKNTTTRHDHVYNNTRTSTDVRESWRSGTSTTLPGGGATRVGPDQYKQYTRADCGQEAVGSSLHRDHKRPLHDNRRARHTPQDLRVVHLLDNRFVRIIALGFSVAVHW